MTTLLARIADLASLVATPLVPSHYVALVNPLWATHRRFARVERVWDETRDTRTLFLRPGRGFARHRPGQWVRIGVAVDGRIRTRTYSIASAPEEGDGTIAITVKAVENGLVSRHLVRSVAVGDYLEIGQPEGDFTLPDATPARLLFVTAGSGITPVASMLRSLAARAAMPDVVHVHYAPSERETIFGAELRALAARFPSYRLHLRATREGGTPPRVSSREIASLVADFAARETWACGPEGMLDALSDAMDAAGAGERLHVERFRPRLAPVPEGETGGTVRFRKSNVATKADAKTPLLLVAESARVNAPHGCRMGICHGCDATLVAGCVRDLRTGKRTSEPGARIQPCISAAAGDVDIDL